jgi:hypothetical protein
MRAATALAMVAFGCGGCALDASETGDDEPAIEAAEDAVASPTVHLSFPRTYQTRAMQVGKGATITASIRTLWDRPSACKHPTISVSLTKVNLILDDTIGEVSHPMNGKTARYSWSALEAGKYRIDLGSANSNPYCNVVGTIDLDVTQ